MRVFSGIQPTGVVHLGNYFGALKNWVHLQNEGHESFICIVNQHAITISKDPKLLKKNTLQVAATLFAVGLSPEKSTIFVQSDVPQHTQLTWILNCLAPIGQMERMIQFKEKSKKDPGSVNFGLLSYPILQAADILLYKANIVPVGKDQAQHLELARELARKFNNTYKPIFPEPETLHTKTTKVVGLDGKAKMSKSLNNYIGLTESSDVIWEKLRVAATDPARVKRTDPGDPFICNIYKLHTLLSSKENIDTIVDGCKQAKIGCIDCKKILFTNIDTFLQPIREQYQQWIDNPDRIHQALEAGAQKAKKTATQTLEEVYKIIGFTY
jgi:tryptophanyl-tRNA synthetase